jgi:site-specific DNA recombinase
MRLTVSHLLEKDEGHTEIGSSNTGLLPKTLTSFLSSM